MEKFNLEKYLANPTRKVLTRNGNSVRIICTDAKSKHPIIALIKDKDNTEAPYRFSTDGSFLSSQDYYLDLFFAPKKKQGWTNIYKHGNKITRSEIFNTKEEAMLFKNRKDYVNTIHIEWEE